MQTIKNKEKYLNRNGFSMVELLAVIVILGILGTIAIVSISTILTRAEKNHYKTQEKNIVMATKSYVNDNRNALPKDIGDSRTVTLEELQNRKYIGEVIDRSKVVCEMGKVTIFKYSQNEYSYRPYIKCQKYETKNTTYDETGLEINLALNTDYANANFRYSIAATGEGKIISYSYAIYKGNILVNDSGSIPVSKVSSISAKEVSLKEYIPGDFKIVFKATNIYGFSQTKTVTGTIVATNAPICEIINPVYTEADWRRYDPNVPIEVTVKCKDVNGSGCAKEIFSQTFNYDVGTYNIEIVDNAGVKNNCTVGVYIDNTPPSKPVIKNDYENTWINKSYTITVTSKDDTGGIAYFEYRYPDSVLPEEREWHKYNNSSSLPGEEKNFVSTYFSEERSEYVEIRACDYAGNCSESTKSMIKIDKTNPICSISRGILEPNGQNGWYITDVTMNMAIQNPVGERATAVISPVTYELTTNTTPVYNKNNLSDIQKEIVSTTWNGYIRDAAGNATSCTDSSGIIKVDTTAPDKPTLEITGTTTLTVKITSADVTSGVWKYEYRGLNSTDPFSTFDEMDKNTITIQTDEPLEIRAIDRAGNASEVAFTKHCNYSGGYLKYETANGWICVKPYYWATESYTTTCDSYSCACPGTCGNCTGKFCYSCCCNTTVSCTQTRQVKRCPSGFSLNGERCIKPAD